MKGYFIELNGAIVKSYKSEKRALTKAREYAATPDNVVRVWSDGEKVWENSKE